MTMPAPAEAHGIGPGLAFGLAAGALTAGVIAASHPYYYGPGGYYYGPRAYYGPNPAGVAAGIVAGPAAAIAGAPYYDSYGYYEGPY